MITDKYTGRDLNDDKPVNLPDQVPADQLPAGAGTTQGGQPALQPVK